MSSLSATPGPPTFIMQFGARDKRDGTKVATLSVGNMGAASINVIMSAVSAGEFPIITERNRAITFQHASLIATNAVSTSVITLPSLNGTRQASAFDVEFDISNTANQTFSLFISSNEAVTTPMLSTVTIEIDKGPMRAALHELGQI